MLYADYSYYTDEYRGTAVGEAEFEFYARRACAYIDSYVLNMPAQVPCAVKDACCAICDILFNEDIAGGISSENNDGYSVTYAKGSDVNEKISGAVAVYLGNTGLLYRGM